VLHNIHLTASQVGMTGKLKLQDATPYKGERSYLIRRMPAERMHEYHPQYNNMFFIVPSHESLYYQNPAGERFMVLFEKLPSPGE